jgi:hypothetical protein
LTDHILDAYVHLKRFFSGREGVFVFRLFASLGGTRSPARTHGSQLEQLSSALRQCSHGPVYPQIDLLLDLGQILGRRHAFIAGLRRLVVQASIESRLLADVCLSRSMTSRGGFQKVLT